MRFFSLGAFFLTVTVVLTTAVTVYFYPQGMLLNFPYRPVCFFKIYTGLNCMLCGATRSLDALLSLNFYHAFRFNPLLFILPIFITIYFYINKYFKNKMIFIILIFIVLFIVTRNLPFQWSRALCGPTFD